MDSEGTPVQFAHAPIAVSTPGKPTSILVGGRMDDSVYTQVSGEPHHEFSVECPQVVHYNAQANCSSSTRAPTTSAVTAMTLDGID